MQGNEDGKILDLYKSLIKESKRGMFYLRMVFKIKAGYESLNKGNDSSDRQKVHLRNI